MNYNHKKRLWVILYIYLICAQASILNIRKRPRLQFVHSITNIAACASISSGTSYYKIRRGKYPLQWSYNERDSVSNHWRLRCLSNCLFRCRSKKTSKLHVTGLCEANSPVTGEFPAQNSSNPESGSIWWRHHENLTHCWLAALSPANQVM